MFARRQARNDYTAVDDHMMNMRSTEFTPELFILSTNSTTFLKPFSYENVPVDSFSYEYLSGNLENKYWNSFQEKSHHQFHRLLPQWLSIFLETTGYRLLQNVQLKSSEASVSIHHEHGLPFSQFANHFLLGFWLYHHTAIFTRLFVS